MFGEALQFPISGDSGVKNLLIGGVLSLLAFLLIPIFFVQGYLVRVLRTSVEGGEEAPVFDEWGDMFVDGLKLFVVSIAYFIVPTIVMFVALFAFIGTAFMSAGAPGEVNPGALAGAGIVGIFLLLGAVLLFLLAAYLLPAAAANFARHDDIGSAFDVGTVVEAALSADYFVAAVIAFVIALIAGIVSSILFALVVGLLLAPFIQFYSQVATYYVMARGFSKGLGLEGSGGASTSPTTTYE